jgi:hypothetical protein
MLKSETATDELDDSVTTLRPNAKVDWLRRAALDCRDILYPQSGRTLELSGAGGVRLERDVSLRRDQHTDV